MTPVTFLRITANPPGTPADQRTRMIYAVPNSKVDDIVRDMSSMPDVDLDTVPTEALPGLADMAAADFAVADLSHVGTTVGDTWTAWNPPTPAPAVPR